MIVTVTGGRDFHDGPRVFEVLDLIHRRMPITLLVQGGSQGADAKALAWAIDRGVQAVTFHGRWKLGRKGGPLRNQAMLETIEPDLLVAFPGNTGTADCVRRAERRGITVERVSP